MKPQIDCPECGSRLDVAIRHTATPGAFQFNVTLGEEDANTLIDVLRSYWRWCAEQYQDYKEKQYYYDPYHNYIDYDAETNTYKFCIQTFDSPEGDVWWSGKFKLEGTTPKIIEQKSELR